MQTSLRSNYQYYDYGTVDCATGHINHELHQHQLSEESVNSLSNLHDHDHIQIPNSTATSNQNHHNHHHHHHQQSLQVISHGGTFDLQSASQIAPVEDDCYQEQQEVTIQETRLENEQLVVYDHHHTHNQYQSLEVNSIINNSNNSQLGSTNQSDLNVENLYQQQQQPFHATTAATTTTTYQTIYYEPINFTDNNCTLEHTPVTEAESGEPVQEQQDFANNHLVHLSQFSEPGHHQLDLQQQQEQQQQNQHQHPPVTNQDGCTYFQYLPQHPTDELTSGQSSNHHSESPLPLIDNQQQLPPPLMYTEIHQNSLSVDENNQIYHTLGNTNHNTTYELGQANQVDQFRLIPGASQLEPDANVQLTARETNGFDNNNHQSYNQTNNHNFYLDSESTGVSIDYSQESRSSTASTSPSEESSASTLTRDEKRAREANIPMTYYEIVNLSIEQFNERLARHNLSESQLTLIKDIRRRGKNKVAAQSCRKRKMEQIYQLQHEVNHLAYKRRSLGIECSQLIKEHGNLVQEYDKICAIIQERMQ